MHYTTTHLCLDGGAAAGTRARAWAQQAQRVPLCISGRLAGLAAQRRLLRLYGLLLLCGSDKRQGERS